MPLTVMLSYCGIRPRRTVKWHRAFQDERGIYYDLDSELRATVSYPTMTKAGGMMFANQKQGRTFEFGLERKGDTVVKTTYTRKGFVPPLTMLTFHFGEEIRRLVVKMCTALCVQLGIRFDVIDQKSRRFLLNSDSSDVPVRISYLHYQELDAIRPALAHVIYVEGSQRRNRCYGVVQFFGTIQFYVVLHGSYPGENFGVMGLLDILADTEKLSAAKPLDLSESPRIMTQNEDTAGHEKFIKTLNEQLAKAFSEPPIRLSGATSVTLPPQMPFLWTEHTVHIAIEILVKPDHDSTQDQTLSRNPEDWVFSADNGETRHNVFQRFVDDWNNGRLGKNPGEQCTWSLDFAGLKILLGKNYWCPICQFRITYEVIADSWRGPDVEIIDQRISTTIPGSPKESWPKLTKEEFENLTTGQLYVEAIRDIRLKDLTLDVVHESTITPTDLGGDQAIFPP